LPGAPERVWPHFKLAKIQHQGYLTSLGRLKTACLRAAG